MLRFIQHAPARALACGLVAALLAPGALGQSAGDVVDATRGAATADLVVSADAKRLVLEIEDARADAARALAEHRAAARVEYKAAEAGALATFHARMDAVRAEYRDAVSEVRTRHADDAAAARAHFLAARADARAARDAARVDLEAALTGARESALAKYRAHAEAARVAYEARVTDLRAELLTLGVTEAAVREALALAGDEQARAAALDAEAMRVAPEVLTACRDAGEGRVTVRVGERVLDDAACERAEDAHARTMQARAAHANPLVRCVLFKSLVDAGARAPSEGVRLPGRTLTMDACEEMVQAHVASAASVPLGALTEEQLAACRAFVKLYRAAWKADPLNTDPHALAAHAPDGIGYGACLRALAHAARIAAEREQAELDAAHAACRALRDTGGARVRVPGTNRYLTPADCGFVLATARSGASSSARPESSQAPREEEQDASTLPVDVNLDADALIERACDSLKATGGDAIAESQTGATVTRAACEARGVI